MNVEWSGQVWTRKVLARPYVSFFFIWYSKGYIVKEVVQSIMSPSCRLSSGSLLLWGFTMCRPQPGDIT